MIEMIWYPAFNIWWEKESLSEVTGVTVVCIIEAIIYSA